MSAYEQALKSGRKTGAARCTDAELMAAICDTTIQVLAGAVSGRLVWEGAQAAGMTTRELVKLASDDPRAVAELMWSS